MRVPPGLGWFVLALVFLDELLVIAALAWRPNGLFGRAALKKV